MLFFNEGYDMSIEKKWRAYDFTKISHDRLIFDNFFLDGFGQIVLVFLTCDKQWQCKNNLYTWSFFGYVLLEGILEHVQIYVLAKKL